jgi:hypothetical protein
LIILFIGLLGEEHKSLSSSLWSLLFLIQIPSKWEMWLSDFFRPFHGTEIFLYYLKKILHHLFSHTMFSSNYFFCMWVWVCVCVCVNTLVVVIHEIIFHNYTNVDSYSVKSQLWKLS